MERAERAERAKRTEKEHASKHVDIESKRFFFDVKENHKGKYLRITELSGGRSCIVIPLGGITLFKERLMEVIEEAEKLIDAPPSF
ncbi:MAG: DNA-binding protein [Candidatus Dadabacteria bacterium]|nr:MAG: DNA-binding protein [Candidatus Dadabacteria bacterium]TDI99879.1 MAG: DNA-binding protein [Candidatus Dadabacteria bacterium]